jgi:hypothetical protein
MASGFGYEARNQHSLSEPSITTMKAAVILLPGLNRDRDMIAALTRISGQAAANGLADRDLDR